MYNQMNNYYGAMQQRGMGTAYAQPKPIHMTQALTPEEIQKLKKREVGPTQITEKEELEAYCTHKDPNTNRLAVVDKGNGNFYCHICGQEFPELDITMEQAQQIVDDFVALLQNTKLFYLDAPQQFIRQFFRIMPLAKKVPQIYANAMKNFRDHEGGMGVVQNPNMYGASVLNAIVGPGMGNPMVTQGIMTGQPMGYPQQPGMGMGYPQQPGMEMGYPQQPGIGMQPQMNMQQGMGMPMQPQMNMQQQNPFFSNGAQPNPQAQQEGNKNIEHRTATLSV